MFPLRLLRLKTSDPKLYKQITSLEGHVEHRQHQVIAYDNIFHHHFNIIEQYFYKLILDRSYQFALEEYPLI